jgi:hypothetical protein
MILDQWSETRFLTVLTLFKGRAPLSPKDGAGRRNGTNGGIRGGAADVLLAGVGKHGERPGKAATRRPEVARLRNSGRDSTTRKAATKRPNGPRRGAQGKTTHRRATRESSGKAERGPRISSKSTLGNHGKQQHKDHKGSHGRKLRNKHGGAFGGTQQQEGPVGPRESARGSQRGCLERGSWWGLYLLGRLLGVGAAREADRL